MQIKDLAVGDGFVYLMEGSTKVKFCAGPQLRERPEREWADDVLPGESGDERHTNRK